MSTLTRTRIRIAGDAACFDPPLDVNRRATPQFWRGNDVQFEIAMFFNGVLLDVSNLSSMTLEIRPLSAGGTTPDPSVTPLMGATVTSFDNTTTLDDWKAGTKQHAVIPFTAAQGNIAAGAAWLSLFVVTNDSPGRVITLSAGPIRILEDGSGLATTPQPATDTFYTAAQSDARFAAIGAGSGASPSDSNPAMDGTAAAGSATTYSRSDHVHPSDTSRAAATHASQHASSGSDPVTLAQSQVTGLASALAALAPLASPTFTGTPAAPTVSGTSDSSTKIATTAFVQAVLASVSGGLPSMTSNGGKLLTNNDSAASWDGSVFIIGSGNVGVGATTAQSIGSPDETQLSARLSVSGGNGLYVNGVGESMFSNVATSGGGPKSNVISLYHGHNSGSAAIRFLRQSDYAEMGAVGYQNDPGGGDTWYGDNSVFIAATMPYINGSTSGSAAPCNLILAQEGHYSGTYYTTARLKMDTSWNINLYDPTGSQFATFKADKTTVFGDGTLNTYSVSGMNPITVCDNYNGNYNGVYVMNRSTGSTATAQISLQCGGNGGPAGSFSCFNSSWSYHLYPPQGCAVISGGSGGLALMATNSSGPIIFAAGGDDVGNEALRIDASKNLLFKNAVTSAPSVTLASGQYQLTVYDNGTTPVLRVRYNNGSTVKVGDLTLS